MMVSVQLSFGVRIATAESIHRSQGFPRDMSKLVGELVLYMASF